MKTSKRDEKSSVLRPTPETDEAFHYSDLVLVSRRLERQRDELAETLREVLRAEADNSGAEPSISVFNRAIYEAYEVLSSLERK